MEPLTINDTFFNGARILFSNLKDGIEVVRKQKIKEVCIWQGLDNTRYSVNFDFLKGLGFIEKFEFLVKLTKKSELSGLYTLSNLRELRWAVDNQLKIDFSKLSTIEILNITYYDGLQNVKKLKDLKQLFIQSVKSDNLMFLSELYSLELLRVINGKFTSLEGLESCINLKKLDLRNCFSLIHADAILQKLYQLESVSLDSCKNHDINIENLKHRVSHVWIG